MDEYMEEILCKLATFLQLI